MSRCHTRTNVRMKLIISDLKTEGGSVFTADFTQIFRRFYAKNSRKISIENIACLGLCVPFPFEAVISAKKILLSSYI